jgi:hypothetical protein
METPYLLTVRGTSIPKTIADVRAIHNATAGSPEGMAAARAASDLSHTVYLPVAGAEQLSGAKPGELLFLDTWVDPAAMQQFFSHKEVQGQAARLFSARDGSLWMPARGAFTFRVNPTAGKPARYVGLFRAPVAAPEKTIEAFAGMVSRNLRASRVRGHISHDLFVRMGAPGEPVEILGVDTWATLEGLSEHYGDPASMKGLDGVLSGAPEASVWEQGSGFNEW